jgi:DNA-directed RNA polymerase specialized sigma24 family protein/ribosome-associated translation inhibitor RaiA
MSDHTVFQGCSDREKESIRSYWRRKLPRIERLLTRFPEDQRELRLTVTHKPKRYDVRAVLLLPTGSLAAEVSSGSEREAIDLLVDKLVGEIRRHRELIRHEDLYRRTQRRQELSRRTAAALQPAVHASDRKAFFALLNPVIARLRHYAHRELLVAELQGRIGHEEVVVTDLLDEVLLRAWERSGRREETEPLDVWLTRLLHEVLDEQHTPVRAARSLHEQVEGAHSADDTAVGFAAEDGLAWDEPPTPTFGDLLPGHEGAEPWQPLEAVDQMKWVLAQLGEVPAGRRRAFTLHLLEGWEPDEIAMVQSRSPEEVRTDIEVVREMLQSRLGKG